MIWYFCTREWSFMKTKVYLYAIETNGSKETKTFVTLAHQFKSVIQIPITSMYANMRIFMLYQKPFNISENGIWTFTTNVIKWFWKKLIVGVLVISVLYVCRSIEWCAHRKRLISSLFFTSYDFLMTISHTISQIEFVYDKGNWILLPDLYTEHRTCGDRLFAMQCTWPSFSVVRLFRVCRVELIKPWRRNTRNATFDFTQIHITVDTRLVIRMPKSERDARCDECAYLHFLYFSIFTTHTHQLFNNHHYLSRHNTNVIISCKTHFNQIISNAHNSIADSSSHWNQVSKINRNFIFKWIYF